MAKITIVVGEIGAAGTLLKMASLSKTGLVLKEPEAHLNPLQKTELAEELIYLSLKNRHLVISTRSDTFLRSLLINSAKRGLIKKGCVAVYEIDETLKWHKCRIYSEGECEVESFAKAIDNITWI